MDENEKVRLRACSALLTNNRREIETALQHSEEVLGSELKKRLSGQLENAPIPGTHRLVNATNYLPAWIQYVGQRAILLFPKISQRLLRSSGLHHQMF